MRSCFHCKRWMDEENFYKCSQTKAGYSCYCKECSREKQREDYRRHKEKRINKNKEYEKTEKGRIARNKAANKYFRNNKKKVLAHRIVNMAIKNGILEPRSCEVCGKDKVDAHHDDYNRPYDVEWLCRACHKNKHKTIKDK